jgi:hypothetical protein
VNLGNVAALNLVSVLLSVAGLLATLGIVASWIGLWYARRRSQWRQVQKVALSPVYATVSSRTASVSANTVRSALSTAASDVARTLEIEPNRVRANVFAPNSDGMLRILPGLSHNMNDHAELAIAIPIGQGTTGTAFEMGRPLVSTFKDIRMESTLADERQRSRTNPDIRWIVAVPIVDPNDRKSSHVLNVDGMDPKPESELIRAVPSLLYWGELILWLLKRGVFHGQE